MLHKHDKETKAVADELAGLSVFSTLERRAVDALAASGRVVHLPAHWALVSESQPADSCYVLLSGSTEVRRHGDVVASLQPGSLVGEAALVEHKTRNATVVTTSDVRALRLGFEELTALFGQYPPVERAFRAEWDKRRAGV
ncbi:MAG TPA: cyclic nucleotide-binding domain-containing protein [Mycobacteriales bacterium]|nr:cyclic nucleotide-binding domain-containing protein [Mycobacteriales bacterium]